MPQDRRGIAGVGADPIEVGSQQLLHLRDFFVERLRELIGALGRFAIGLGFRSQLSDAVVPLIGQKPADPANDADQDEDRPQDQTLYCEQVPKARG